MKYAFETFVLNFFALISIRLHFDEKNILYDKFIYEIIMLLKLHAINERFFD